MTFHTEPLCRAENCVVCMTRATIHLMGEGREYTRENPSAFSKFVKKLLKM